jgi:hypothetical protein
MGGAALASGGVVRVPICFSPQAGGADRCRWKVGDEEVALDTKSPVAMSSVVHLQTDVAKQDL